MTFKVTIKTFDGEVYRYDEPHDESLKVVEWFKDARENDTLLCVIQGDGLALISPTAIATVTIHPHPTRGKGSSDPENGHPGQRRG